MKERILCAAIWYKELSLKSTLDVLPLNCDKGIVITGYRHPQCIWIMLSLTGLKSVVEAGEYVQGFLTSKNRFVDRTEGATIHTTTKHINKLFSEDLY